MVDKATAVHDEVCVEPLVTPGNTPPLRRSGSAPTADLRDASTDTEIGRGLPILSMIPIHPQPLREKQGTEAVEIVFTGAADQRIAILRPVGDLREGIRETQLKLLIIFGAAIGETFAKGLHTGRQDEDIGETAVHQIIVTRAHLLSALDVDIHDHIDAALEVLFHVGLERAVVIIVDAGMLEELAALDVIFELSFREEEIILPVNFTRARRARGAGNGIHDFAHVSELAAKRGFSRS